MTRTTARLTGLAGALLAGALVLAGCSSTDHTSAHGSGSSTSAGAETTHNDADIAFAHGMLPHHQGAISMAELAPGRAADTRVLDLAARIRAAQRPEIDTLNGWLADWGADGTSGMDHGSMDHASGGMGGRMSEQDMNALTNATGAEFDRLFLRLMIEHHSGAVDMAVTEAADGRNTDTLAMAGNIRDSQTAEIAEMQALLTGLGG